MAGRTLRLLKSVNGIGSRIRSPREQFIEDIVRVVVPNLTQAAFRLREPGGAVPVVRDSLDREADMGVLGQRERLEGTQYSVFVDGFDGSGHAVISWGTRALIPLAAATGKSIPTTLATQVALIPFTDFTSVTGILIFNLLSTPRNLLVDVGLSFRGFRGFRSLRSPPTAG